MDKTTIQNQIISFLRSATGSDSLDGGTDLLDAGVTDSLTMMDLLVFIETELKVRLDFADLNPDVFRTPQTLADLIALRQDAGRRSAAA